MKLNLILFGFLLLLENAGNNELSAQITAAVQEPVVGIAEHVGRKLPADIYITDEKGELVNLNKMIDKPTVITFVYYRCPGLCSPLLDGLADAIDRTALEIGTDYQVFTISFDPSEGTALARQKKASYLGSMSNKKAGAGWHFFTADSLNVARITSATGFKYKRTGKDFLHAATLIMVNPNAKISRYLNGTHYKTADFKLAILDVTPLNTSNLSDQVEAYFFKFDPVLKQYQLKSGKIAGLAIVILSIGFFLFLMLKPAAKKNLHADK
ncbi:MAG TPA: SCO family protein [Bacteroidales bacterium]|nr:SCO family protein [Bacteroidales bacterium]